MGRSHARAIYFLDRARQFLAEMVFRFVCLFAALTASERINQASPPPVYLQSLALEFRPVLKVNGRSQAVAPLHPYCDDFLVNLNQPQPPQPAMTETNAGDLRVGHVPKTPRRQLIRMISTSERATPGKSR